MRDCSNLINNFYFFLSSQLMKLVDKTPKVVNGKDDPKEEPQTDEGDVWQVILFSVLIFYAFVRRMGIILVSVTRRSRVQILVRRSETPRNRFLFNFQFIPTPWTVFNVTACVNPVTKPTVFNKTSC